MFLYRALNALFPRSFAAKLFAVVLLGTIAPPLALVAHRIATIDEPAVASPFMLHLLVILLVGTAVTFAGIWRLLAPLRLLAEEIDRFEADGDVADTQIAGSDVVARLGNATRRMMTRASHRAGRSDTDDWADQLTGALNRQGLDNALERLGPSASGVLFIDLDGFDALIETRGQELHNSLLADAAQAIAGATRRGDIFARLDVASFLVILPGVMEEDLRLSTARILKRVADVGFMHGIRLTASAGTAQRRSGRDWSETIGRAEVAMRRAKGEGKNRARHAA